MSIEDWLSARTKASPDALALIYGEQHWTYFELDQQVSEMCCRLGDFIQPGHHVGTLLPNSPAHILLIHALARLGAVLVPLNTRLVPRELRILIEQSDCHFLVYSESTSDLAHSSTLKASQMLNLEDLLELGEMPEIEPSSAFHFDNLQAIVFTSGSTGVPKGAMLTFANNFWSAASSAFRLGVNQDDRWLSCLPLYHVGGLAVIFRSCLYGTAVILHDRFDVEAISNSLDNQKVTLISLVPTMVHRLLDHRQGRSWPNKLRHLLLGGAKAGPDLIEQCMSLGIQVSTTYGLTEAASQVATSLPQNTAEKPGSVGKPLIFSSVSIVDTQGEKVPVGKIGEIVVSGPTVMNGYYNDPQATAETLRNGKLHTGDIGYIDHDGDLWVLQRRSDIIISGGENIYPAEVEGILRQHTAISAVCIAAIPDEEWGQSVGAMIVLHENTSVSIADILEYGRNHLAGYKLPKTIKIVSQLPQTASGKIQRHTVAAELSELKKSADSKKTFENNFT